MREKRWTPGPWRVGRLGHAHVEAEKRSTVANCGGWSDNREDDNGASEKIANAHLVSAAPELVEALEAAMKYIEESPCDPDITADQAAAWKRLKDTRPEDVLTKAYGDDSNAQ